MAKFIVEPHFRLQEWVADDKGYFSDEGLDYVFQELVRSSDGRHHDRGDKVGAFQSFERGREDVVGFDGTGSRLVEFGERERRSQTPTDCTLLARGRDGGLEGFLGGGRTGVIVESSRNPTLTTSMVGCGRYRSLCRLAVSAVSLEVNTLFLVPNSICIGNIVRNAF